MRATTAFNKMLAIPGADIVGVTFTPNGILVDLRRRARRLTCPCGWSTQAVSDRSDRHWRGLDLGATRLVLRAEIRRLQCRSCGRVRTEAVPWARPGARFTRDFEDVVTSLAQRMDKTAVSRLLRCSWQAVAGIVTRVVADHVDDHVDDARLDDVYRIGVDEVSYRKGHRYLTVVADHDRDGAVIWAGEGKSGATLEQFFDQLGPAPQHPDRGRLGRSARRLRTRHRPARATSSGLRRPVPRHQDRQPGRRRGAPQPVEHRSRRGPSDPGQPALANPAGPRRSADQTHPMGTAQRPRHLDRPPARADDPAAQSPARALPCLGPQRGTT